MNLHMHACRLLHSHMSTAACQAYTVQVMTTTCAQAAVSMEGPCPTRNLQQLAAPEGPVLRVALPRDLLEAAPVLCHELGQLLHYFAHIWVLRRRGSRARGRHWTQRAQGARSADSWGQDIAQHLLQSATLPFNSPETLPPLSLLEQHWAQVFWQTVCSRFPSAVFVSAPGWSP